MKRNKLYVAVTGGIGSGKSTVMQMIKEQGYPVFSADEIARHIYEEEDVLEQMRLAFSDCVSGRTIDRQKLAGQVFADSEKLKLLDSITHPAVMKKLYAMMEQSEGRRLLRKSRCCLRGIIRKILTASLSFCGTKKSASLRPPNGTAFPPIPSAQEQNISLTMKKIQ